MHLPGWLKVTFCALLVLLIGEAGARLWDAYDAWKKYQKFLTQTVTHRDQSYSISKPPETRRILLLGGSAAYDTVDDYRKSWPHYLENLLTEHYQKKIEVINLGFYSECSTDELFKLHEFGMELDPDLVIVFDGFNDVYNLWHHYDYWKRLYEIKAKIILHEKEHHPLTNLRIAVQKKSALIQRMRQMGKWFQRKLSLRALKEKRLENKEEIKKTNETAKKEENSSEPDLMEGVGEGPGQDQFFEDLGRWPEIFKSYQEIYSDNLTKMAKLIKRARSQGLFIFQPDMSYKPLISDQTTEREREEYLGVIGKHEKSWHAIQNKAYPAGQDIMASIAKTYHFPYADFNQEILLQSEVHELFEGNVHFSEKGRRLIAQEVARIIVERDLLN